MLPLSRMMSWQWMRVYQSLNASSSPGLGSVVTRKIDGTATRDPSPATVCASCSIRSAMPRSSPLRLHAGRFDRSRHWPTVQALIRIAVPALEWRAGQLLGLWQAHQMAAIVDREDRAGHCCIGRGEPEAGGADL